MKVPINCSKWRALRWKNPIKRFRENVTWVWFVILKGLGSKGCRRGFCVCFGTVRSLTQIQTCSTCWELSCFTSRQDVWKWSKALSLTEAYGPLATSLSRPLWKFTSQVTSHNQLSSSDVFIRRFDVQCSLVRGAFLNEDSRSWVPEAAEAL